MIQINKCIGKDKKKWNLKNKLTSSETTGEYPKCFWAAVQLKVLEREASWT